MMKNIAGALIIAALSASPGRAQTQAAPSFAAAQKQFDGTCAGCHGEGGGGGDRAPALINNITLRPMTQAQIRDLIKSGTPGGMPAFNLPENQLQELAGWLRSLNQTAFDTKPAGDVAAGEAFFFGKGQCSSCHMVHGRGQVKGPDLSAIGRRAIVRELELVLENPTSQMGIHTTATCPRWAFCPDETWQIVDVKLRDGSRLRGFARGRAEHDLELQDLDGRMHFLTDKDYVEITPQKASYMPPLQASAEERRNLIAYLSSLGGVQPGAISGAEAAISPEAINAVLHPKSGEWTTYNGILGGNRHSALNQINTGNVQNLQMEWVYSLNVQDLETTPIVSDGVMYVTAADKVCALGAATGRELWCYMRADDRPGRRAQFRRAQSGCGPAWRPRVLHHPRRPSDMPEPADRRADVGRQRCRMRRAAMARPRLPWWSATWSSRALVAATVRCSVSWLPTRPPRANRPGAFTRCPSPASRLPKPGRAGRCPSAAAPPG